MKISKQQLEKLIKESVQNQLNESLGASPERTYTLSDNQLQDIARVLSQKVYKKLSQEGYANLGTKTGEAVRQALISIVRKVSRNSQEG